ncbi:MAG: hypothetical protein C0477_13680 [Delftia sp.]|nr:hypothetical protein [Delftia sp.]
MCKCCASWCWRWTCGASCWSAMTMARALGAVQATLLDHACTQLEATMEDAEQLARSDSASEAIALQAKAVRRSFESYAEHLKELARIASGALKKD